MRSAQIWMHEQLAGILTEEANGQYRFAYESNYQGPPISLTMPVDKQNFTFAAFPAFFDGLLPEGVMLEALLKQGKLDKTDLFGQLLMVGSDTVGAVTIKEIK